MYERLDAALDASCEAISEVCDQQDNDCDGRIDEGFGLREPCVIGVGACERTGVWACGANGGAICDAPLVMPSAELCNAIDDDCDGVVDEGYPAVGMPCEGPEGNCRETGVYRCSSDGRSLTCVQPDTLAVERCNGADDDCDSLVDEGFGVGEICTVGVGQCARGSIGACDSSGAARCPAVPGEPTSEMCDGLDNDCDGLVDEGYGGGPCLVGRGACTREGFFACQPDGDPVCMAEAGSPRYETCNGIDDDCDGLTDERWGSLGDACAAGAGACESRGVIECDGRPDYRLPFEGVRTDLMLRALEDDGYRICWRGGYGIAGEEIEGILSACDGDVLLMGCRRREAPIELSVAAVGYRAEVLAAVGPEPTASRIHNGVQWYFDEDSSWGFAPQGARLARHPCDIEASLAALRLCWDTVNGRLGDGYRCGADRGHLGEFERLILQRAGGPVAQCSAEPLPAQVLEVCNHIDDDCDGEVDEGFPAVGQDCVLEGVEGCGVARTQCDMNGEIRCVWKPREPQLENCDGVDNDCDGVIDELTGQADELCEGQAVGPCEVIDAVCINGVAECVSRPDLNAVESCNGRDDDCDGIVDESFVDLGQACRVGVGQCEAEGVWRCGGTGDSYDLALNGTLTDIGHDVLEARGYTLCWRGDYGEEAELADIFMSCRGAELLLGCGSVGDGVLDVAAAGARGRVTQDVDRIRSPDNVHNGVSWYFDDDYSWGFAAAGLQVLRRTCDVGLADPQQRLCWHTQDGRLTAGYRCGEAVGVNQSGIWERVIYQRDASALPACDVRPGQPSEELCNGRDDDCDGSVDEGVRCP
ncbi:MAG: MopE-related protein [Bradymonadia bacterium]